MAKIKLVIKKSPQAIENKQDGAIKVALTPENIGGKVDPAERFMRRRMGVAFAPTRRYLFRVGV